MIVAGAKPAQHHASLVRFSIAVGILQEQQFGAVTDIRAAIAQFDPGWNHQAVGKDGGPVAPPVAIGVFKDEHLVVRRLSRFDLWIDRAADDPQSPTLVEANLDRFHDTVLFRGEEIDLEAVGDLEGGQFGGGILRVGSERRNAKRQTPNTKETPDPKLKHAV